jgi:hypothetical protein
MRGEGNIAQSVNQLFKLFRNKYYGENKMPDYDFTKFQRGGQMSLF